MIRSGKEFSKELIEKVKEVYPDNKEFLKYAENGNRFLVRIVDEDSFYGYESIYKDLSTSDKTAEEKFEEIMKRSKIAESQADVYAMWWDEQNAQKDGE